MIKNRVSAMTHYAGEALLAMMMQNLEEACSIKQGRSERDVFRYKDVTTLTLCSKKEHFAGRVGISHPLYNTQILLIQL